MEKTRLFELTLGQTTDYNFMLPFVPESVLVEIGSRYKDEITTPGGLKLFIDTKWRPEWNATVTGKVHQIPRQLDLTPPFKGIKPTVKIGDEVAFSYLVVFDHNWADDYETVFFEDTPVSPFVTSYTNKQGLRLAVKYRLDDRFDVAAFDDEGNVYLKGEKLTMKQKDHWLSAFRFNESQTMSHNNILEWEGKEYWRVHYGHLMAIKREEKLIPVGDHVFIEEMAGMKVRPDGSLIELINPLEQHRTQAYGKIISIGEPIGDDPELGLKAGDIVAYDSRYAQDYELWGKEYKVLRQRHLLAVKNNVPYDKGAKTGNAQEGSLR